MNSPTLNPPARKGARGSQRNRWAHHSQAWGLALVLVGVLASCGGNRVLRVTSEPSGALVRLDEEVIGTTPLEYPFDHYGHRRLSLYLGGYRNYSEPIHLKAPWHARFPIDVFTEVLLPLGLKYTKEEHVELELETGKVVIESIGSFVERAEALRRALPGQVDDPQEARPAPAGPEQDAPKPEQP